MIRISGLEALTTSYCLTSTSVEDMRKLNDIYTTATSVSTTLATAMPYESIHIDIANQYMSSLTTEQLVKFEEMVSEKEYDIHLKEENNSPKIYQKTNSNRVQTNRNT